MINSAEGKSVPKIHKYKEGSNTLNSKRWRKENPEKARKNWREKHWRQLGIIKRDSSAFLYTDFDYLYQIQQGSCAICKRHQSTFERTLAADHDHKTGFIRGLLCLGCNSMLGVLENKEFVKAALLYLETK
jgi:hypothetical protein